MVGVVTKQKELGVCCEESAAGNLQLHELSWTGDRLLGLCQ